MSKFWLSSFKLYKPLWSKFILEILFNKLFDNYLLSSKKLITFLSNFSMKNNVLILKYFFNMRIKKLYPVIWFLLYY